MDFSEFLKLISDPVNAKTDMLSLIFMELFTIIAFVIMVNITIQVFRNRAHAAGAKKIVNFLLYTLLTVLFRSLLIILTLLVQLLTDGERQLKGIDSLHALTLFLIFWFLIQFRKLIIQVTKEREGFYTVISILDWISLLLLLAFSLLFLFVSNSSTRWHYSLFLSPILLLFMWLLFGIMYRESSQHTSKLTTIRIRLYAYVILFVSLSLTVTPIAIFMAIAGWYVNVIPILYHLSLAIFDVLMAFSVYWSFFIPQWLKKRYGLTLAGKDLL